MERKLFLTIALAAMGIGSLFYTSNHNWILFVLISCPVLFVLSFKYCFLCIKKLPQVNFKTIIFILGLTIIVGASLLDNIITHAKNPDLSRESNIITLSLFFCGMSLYQVIFVDLFFQAIFITASVLLWILCYKSLPIILGDLKGKDFLRKVLMLIGMQKLILKNILFSTDEAFYANAYLGMSMLCACTYRIYCILEWLNIVPMSKFIAPAIVFSAFNVAYFAYLIFHNGHNYSKDYLGSRAQLPG